MDSSSIGGARFSAATICAAALSFVCYGLDQLTKAVIAGHVAFGDKIVVIPGFFNITYITNPGAAWGIFHGRKYLLLLISVAAFAAVVVFFRRICEGWPERAYALALICSGIAGNCTDRLFRGEVVDFIELHAARFFYWPSFNVADSCITVGVIIFIASSIFRPDLKKMK